MYEKMIQAARESSRPSGKSPFAPPADSLLNFVLVLGGCNLPVPFSHLIHVSKAWTSNASSTATSATRSSSSRNPSHSSARQAPAHAQTQILNPESQSQHLPPFSHLMPSLAPARSSPQSQAAQARALFMPPRLPVSSPPPILTAFLHFLRCIFSKPGHSNRQEVISSALLFNIFAILFRARMLYIIMYF
jgi:hypothetical protein